MMVNAQSSMGIDLVKIDTVTLRQINNYVFKDPKDAREYLVDKINIRIVLPYVKMLKHIYQQVEDQKKTDTKNQFRHYHKDLHKETQAHVEEGMKKMGLSQAKLFFKLLSRETGQTPYLIIKECKNGFSAWVYQLMAEQYDYSLKEKYDPDKEKIIEAAISYLGADYDPN
jgi:hypothetical protein